MSGRRIRSTEEPQRDHIGRGWPLGTDVKAKNPACTMAKRKKKKRDNNTLVLAGQGVGTLEWKTSKHGDGTGLEK